MQLGKQAEGDVFLEDELDVGDNTGKDDGEASGPRQTEDGSNPEGGGVTRASPSEEDLWGVYGVSGWQPEEVQDGSNISCREDSGEPNAPRSGSEDDADDEEVEAEDSAEEDAVGAHGMNWRLHAAWALPEAAMEGAGAAVDHGDAEAAVEVALEARGAARETEVEAARVVVEAATAALQAALEAVVAGAAREGDVEAAGAPVEVAGAALQAALKAAGAVVAGATLEEDVGAARAVVHALGNAMEAALDGVGAAVASARAGAAYGAAEAAGAAATVDAAVEAAGPAVGAVQVVEATTRATLGSSMVEVSLNTIVDTSFYIKGPSGGAASTSQLGLLTNRSWAMSKAAIMGRQCICSLTSGDLGMWMTIGVHGSHKCHRCGHYFHSPCTGEAVL